MEGYRLSHQVLTKDELVSVMTGLKGLQSHSDDLDVARTLEKMRALLKKAIFIIQTKHWNNGLLIYPHGAAMRRRRKNNSPSTGHSEENCRNL